MHDSLANELTVDPRSRLTSLISVSTMSFWTSLSRTRTMSLPSRLIRTRCGRPSSTPVPTRNRWVRSPKLKRATRVPSTTSRPKKSRRPGRGLVTMSSPSDSRVRNQNSMDPLNLEENQKIAQLYISGEHNRKSVPWPLQSVLIYTHYKSSAQNCAFERLVVCRMCSVQIFNIRRLQRLQSTTFIRRRYAGAANYMHGCTH